MFLKIVLRFWLQPPCLVQMNFKIVKLNEIIRKIQKQSYKNIFQILQKENLESSNEQYSKWSKLPKITQKNILKKIWK
jgi:glutaredoxin-related protein